MQLSKLSFPHFSLTELTKVLAIAAILTGILAIFLTLSFGFSEGAFVTGSILWYLFLIPFTFLDCWRRIGWKKTLIFVGLVVGLCFAAEYLGTKYGLFFGSYTYQPENMMLGLQSFNPVLLYTIVVFMWWLIIYLAFATTNTLVGGFPSSSRTASTLPKAQGRRMSNALWLFSLAATDGLIATNLDIILDPVSVKILGHWTWHGVGSNSYYGIPHSNFVTWFVLVLLVTLIFRTHLWATSSSELKARIANSSSNTVSVKTSSPSWLEYVPPLLYFIFQLRLSTIAIQTGYPEYAFVGIAVMLPFLLVAIVLFQVRRTSQAS